MTEKAVWALEVMKSLHDFGSVVTVVLLAWVRDRYSFLTEYELHAPWPGQRAHDPFSDGFRLTLDTFKVELRFPLHPVIEACLSWWRISP